MLLSKIEQKEFESKSQLLLLCLLQIHSCYQRSNKKNLKANHNGIKTPFCAKQVVIKDRTKRI